MSRQIDILDKLYRLYDELDMVPLDVTVRENTVKVNVWSLRECRIIRRKLLDHGWQEVTIRQNMLGWSMTADYPVRFLIPHHD